jgi:hypothetical protein
MNDSAVTFVYLTKRQCQVYTADVLAVKHRNSC